MTKELIQKFISNSCSEAEREFVYHWLSDPQNKEEVSAMMKTSWDSMSDKMPLGVRSKESFIENVLDRNNDQELLENLENTRTIVEINRTTDSGKGWSWFKIAAAIALLMTLGFATYKLMLPSAQVEEVVFIEKHNPNGRKSTIILPDGSKVKLNSDSKIRYQSNFVNDTREVILEGEAFFEVEKDKTRPFIVRSADITTTVLGTSFNVKAYANSEAIDVAVITGKVEVKKASYSNEETDVTYLTPNKMAVYQRNSQKLTTSSFNTEEITGWKDGVLIFKNADLTQIAYQITKWYGYKVVIEGDQSVLSSKRYTGKFDNNSLEYVLKAISYTSDLDFEILNKQVKLKQK